MEYGNPKVYFVFLLASADNKLMFLKFQLHPLVSEFYFQQEIIFYM